MPLWVSGLRRAGVSGCGAAAHIRRRVWAWGDGCLGQLLSGLRPVPGSGVCGLRDRGVQGPAFPVYRVCGFLDCSVWEDGRNLVSET